MKTFILLSSLILFFGASNQVAAGDAITDEMVNHLMANGVSRDEIIRIKALPKWPSCDRKTGFLIDGDQRWYAADGRSVYIYTVKTDGVAQSVTKRKIYDYTKNGE